MPAQTIKGLVFVPDDEPVAPILLNEDDEAFCEDDGGESDPSEEGDDVVDPLEQLGDTIAEMLPPSCRTPEQMHLLGQIIGFGLGYYGSRPFWKWLFGVEE